MFLNFMHINKYKNVFREHVLIYTIIKETSYKKRCVCVCMYVLCGSSVDWLLLCSLMCEMCVLEERSLMLEYSVRSKCSVSLCLLNLPVLSRSVEKYINPLYSGWESRYNKMLFSCDVRDVCVNYIEGLEWVYKYYTSDCVDWRWRYKYNYAPLLVDCVKWLPKEKKELCIKRSLALSEGEALKYVMPPENPKGRFEWAFCRYFWECHPLYTADEYKDCSV